MLLAGASASRGDEAAAVVAPAPAVVVNPAAAQERAAAQNLRREADANDAKAGMYEGSLKAAAQRAAAARRKEADAREALAKAMEEGNAERSNALNAEMPRVAGRTVWAWRKLGAFESAAEYAKPLAESVVKDTPEPARPALEALGAAQQAAAKAWEKYAMAIDPDNLTADIDEAYEGAQASVDSLRVASLAWSFSTGAAYRRSAAATLGSPDLERKIAEWEKQNQELLETLRQQNELTAKVRKLERALAGAEAARAAMAEKLAAEAKARAAAPAAGQ